MLVNKTCVGGSRVFWLYARTTGIILDSKILPGAGKNLFYPVTKERCARAQVDRVFQPDTVREFLITRVDNRSGEVQLSIKRLETAILWQRLRQLRDYKVYYPAHVVSANQSGVLAEVHGQSGFIPGSHIPNVRALAPATTYQGIEKS